MGYLRFIFSGFWVFVGTFLLLAATFAFLLECWNRFWRHMNIRKHGYPPIHCDADGDFENPKKDHNEN